MTDFNKDIQSRVEEYLNKISKMAVNGIVKSANTPQEIKDKYSNAVTSIKFIKSSHDEGDPQDYISNQDTCYNHLEYQLSIKTSEGVEKYAGGLKVPYMMNNGSFIIDGKLRIATNNMTMTYDCSYSPEDHKFQLNNTQFFLNDDKVVASFKDETGSHSVRIYNQQDLESLGIELNFTEDQKLKLLYLTDTKYEDKGKFPDKLTYDFLKSLPNIKGIERKRDSVANVRISSISDSLIDYLNEWDRGQGPKAKILSGIKSGVFYPGKGRSASLALGSVYTFIMRFFRQASKSGIDIASVVNPMVFDQLHNKIKMPKYIPYTMQFSDLIDAPNTPENGNVNIINELNVCIYHNDEEGVGIYCYNYPYGDKLGVKYNEYINELVLSNDEWDYDNNKLKDPFKSKYRVKYHTYTIELDSNKLGDVKYIEPKVDDKFSISSRTIPFLNSSDSVRIAMGGGMVKQSVELEQPEDPIIASGNTEIDSESSSMNTYANEDGIVELKDGVLGVKYDSGVFQAFPKPISGMNYITISSTSLVNPGDKVKKGQKLTTATTANGSYKLGTNARVFYLNYNGLTYEDGVVVSKSFAEKLTHWTLHDVVINIYYGDEIEYIIDYGSVVNSGDELFKSTSNPISIEGKDLSESDSKMKTVLSKLTNITKVPSNIDNGVIIAASYELNTDWAKKNKVKYDTDNQDIISEFIDSINHPSDDAKKNIERVPKIYLNQDLGRTHRWVAQNKYGQSIIGVIRFKIAVRRPLIIGDKLCNRYGSKGMVSCIIPDDCRPYYIENDGSKVFADIIANPASIIGRKNSSQLNEALLSKCIEKIFNMTLSAKTDEELTEVLALIKDIYGEQHKDLDLDGLKAMRDSGLTAFKISVGTFHEDSYHYVMRIVEKLNIAETEEVYAPSFSMHENKSYDVESKNVGLELRCIEDENGDIDDSKRFSDGTDCILGWLDQPLVIGYNYYYKLYHSAVWSGSVTPVRENVKSTILGKGKIRKTGQSISEMEKWALQATGASEFYQDPVRSPSYESGQYELVNALLRGGYELS